MVPTFTYNLHYTESAPSIIAALSITLAWGIEGLSEIIQGSPSSTLKFISLVAIAISSVLSIIVSTTWRRV